MKFWGAILCAGALASTGEGDDVVKPNKCNQTVWVEVLVGSSDSKEKSMPFPAEDNSEVAPVGNEFHCYNDRFSAHVKAGSLTVVRGDGDDWDQNLRVYVRAALPAEFLAANKHISEQRGRAHPLAVAAYNATVEYAFHAAYKLFVNKFKELNICQDADGELIESVYKQVRAIYALKNNGQKVPERVGSERQSSESLSDTVQAALNDPRASALRGLSGFGGGFDRGFRRGFRHGFGHGFHRPRELRKLPNLPPSWERPGGRANPHMNDLAAFKDEQARELQAWRQAEATPQWQGLYNRHFDWWMFPCDFGSIREWVVGSQEQVDSLKNDQDWLAEYQASFKLVLKSWGWDADNRVRIANLEPGMGYHGKTRDIRLAKMCRSAYLFEQEDLLGSLQAFAKEVQANEKRGAPFEYVGDNLNNLLELQLPRRQ